jgi:TPR repeat protein
MSASRFAALFFASLLCMWGQSVRPDLSEVHTLTAAIDDGVKALAELRLLAAEGDAAAQNALGAIYSNHFELRDLDEAVRWFRKAALQGLPMAQGSLGYSYAAGVGVEQDAELAILWLNVSAEQGHWLAQATLGDLYRGQHGIDPDLVQTYKWYTVAASVLSEKGRADIRESMLDRRRRIAARMTPDQIAEAEELAAAWTRQDWDALKQRIPPQQGTVAEARPAR